MTPEETKVLEAWNTTFVPMAIGLFKTGSEGLMLAAIAGAPNTTARFITASSASSDPQVRKVAASLVGHLPGGSALLASLLDGERTHPEAERQPVAEALVLSAGWLSRQDDDRPAALGFLRELVEATMRGEPWSSAVDALTVLVARKAEGAQTLAKAFATWADGAGAPPRVRTLAHQLVAGEWNAVQAVDSQLDDRAANAAGVALEDDAQTAFHLFLSDVWALG